MNNQQRWILTFGCAIALFLAILPGCYNPTVLAQAKAKNFCKTAKFWKIVSLEQKTTDSLNDKLVLKLIPAIFVVESSNCHYDEKGRLRHLQDTTYTFDLSEQRDFHIEKEHPNWHFLLERLKVDGVVAVMHRNHHYPSSTSWMDYIWIIPRHVSRLDKNY